MNRLKTYIAEVTGPQLFNYQIYMFFLPVFWVTSVLANVQDFTLSNVVVWTIANALAIAVGLLVIVIADKWLFPNRESHPANIFVVLLLGLFVGASKGFLTTYLAYLLGAESDLGFLASRTIQASILGLITLPSLALVAATQTRFQRERDALVAEKVRHSVGDGFESEKVLESLRQRLDGLILKEQPDQKLPALLHDVVRETLRPLSQRLWAEENQRASDYSFRSLTRIAFMNHPFPAAPVMLIVGVGSFFPYLQNSSFSEALLRSLITGSVIFVNFWLASKVKQSTFKGAVSYFLAVNAAVSIQVVAISALLVGKFSNYNNLAAFFVLFIWIAQTAFMTGFIKGVLSNRAEIRGEFERFSKKLGLDTDVLKAKAALTNRSLANHLHSNVQNKLLLLALKLERGEIVQTRTELEQIQSLLVLNSDSRTLGLEDELLALKKLWDGFATINFTVEGNGIPDLEAGKVISEAVNNSVRHGLAHQIYISVNLDGQYTKIKVDDDGIGPRSGKPGLGSSYFDSISARRWTLSHRESGGASLEMVLG